MNEREELIQKAMSIDAVKDLYACVSEQSPITIKSIGKGPWGSTTENGQTTISVAPTQWPSESLSHELLHAKLKLLGYRQYSTVCSMNNDQGLLKSIVEALDNELQHHRMFTEFLTMGFNPIHFYFDGDTDAYRTIRKEIKLMGPSTHVGQFFLKFVTVIAPGGRGQSNNPRRWIDHYPHSRLTRL